MSRRSLLGVMLCLVIVAGLLVGCAGATKPTPNAAGSTAQASTAVPTKISAAEPKATPTIAADIPEMTLRVAQYSSQSDMGAQMVQWWADEITKRTGGKVKFQIFWNGSLIGGSEMLDAVANGSVDIGEVTASYDPAKTPLWAMLDLGMRAEDYWCSMSVAEKLYESDPDLKAELDKNGIFPLVRYQAGQGLWAMKNKTEHLADMKGKRIRTFGGWIKDWQREMGQIPLFMSFPEVYEGLDRGVIDGAVTTVSLADSTKQYEVAKYFVKMFDSGSIVAAPSLSINLKLWNSFPESLKQIFLQVGREHDMRLADTLAETEMLMLERFQEEAGCTVVTLSPEEQAESKAALDRVVKANLAELDGQGLPASKLFQRWTEMNKQCVEEVKKNGYPSMLQH